MPATRLSMGDIWNVIAPSAVLQGDVEAFADYIGVWLDDVAAGAEGALDVRGEHRLPKASADDIAVGAKLYWHTTNLNLTVTAAGAVYAGRASEAAGAGATEASVVLNAGNL